jgi:hypothetical protein
MMEWTSPVLTTLDIWKSLLRPEPTSAPPSNASSKVNLLYIITNFIEIYKAQMQEEGTPVSPLTGAEGADAIKLSGG